ncbi:PHD finger protein At1g33420 [Oryza brachyantha]|uniref:Zinc finger PHD-type domain-containing protein n=1 Tax=Oryza brachyantha TaxID=4533 RepID=J3L6D8_ORYBR|nr:PHD finger protein At1g33420 [Oryza brachyantha]
MVVNSRPLKRARTRVEARDFEGFPPAGDGGAAGTFREAVRGFLARYARLLPLPSIFSPAAAAAPPHLLTWRVSLRVGEEGDEEGGGAAVELNVVEEDVLRSRSVYCDQCRVVGWSGHPVCGKRYHFIIENDNSQVCGRRHSCCLRCGTPTVAGESRCLLCNFDMEGEELEECGYLHLDDNTHLLHAVVHANGYGHLLRVNGREGGSKCLTGRDIMSFWDRLCKVLHTRKVTVMDISKKHGMEYRLLHAITSGHPWYGEWGYKFGAGSFGLSSDTYQEAVDMLSSIQLSLYFSHRQPIRTPLQNTIALYWALADRQLVTVRDLFRFIMHLLHQARKNEISKPTTDEHKEVASNVLCKWTKDDVDRAEAAMLKVLRAVQTGQWVSWRALRGASSKAVDSQELLDSSLRGLGGKLMDDGHIIAVRCNAETSAIEYRLEDYSSQSPVNTTVFGPSVDHLLHDLKFLYNALLNPEIMLSSQPEVIAASSHSAAAKILDCKQFIKHYDEHTPRAPLNPFLLSVRCSIELLDHPKDYTAPPVELVLLPASATLAELKIQATRAFQETYLMFQSFQVEQLPDFPNFSDTTLVKHVLGSNQLVRVRGRCTGDNRRIVQFRMERGLENWTVDCTCGAKDDDGERMMACDVCGVWQHTRCSGISDLDDVPEKFICRKCASPRRGKGHGGGGGNGGSRMDVSAAGRCKDEIGSSVGGAGKFGHMATVG